MPSTRDSTKLCLRSLGQKLRFLHGFCLAGWSWAGLLSPPFFASPQVTKLPSACKVFGAGITDAIIKKVQMHGRQLGELPQRRCKVFGASITNAVAPELQSALQQDQGKSALPVCSVHVACSIATYSQLVQRLLKAKHPSQRLLSFRSPRQQRLSVFWLCSTLLLSMPWGRISASAGLPQRTF